MRNWCQKNIFYFIFPLYNRLLKFNHLIFSKQIEACCVRPDSGQLERCPAHTLVQSFAASLLWRCPTPGTSLKCPVGPKQSKWQQLQCYFRYVIFARSFRHHLSETVNNGEWVTSSISCVSSDIDFFQLKILEKQVQYHIAGASEWLSQLLRQWLSQWLCGKKYPAWSEK